MMMNTNQVQRKRKESSEEELGEEETAKMKTAKQKAQEYFTSASFVSYRHKWLCGFYGYLGLPAAGYKKVSIRVQHASQVKILLEALDPAGTDITCLGDDNGDAVWKK